MLTRHPRFAFRAFAGSCGRCSCRDVISLKAKNKTLRTKSGGMVRLHEVAVQALLTLVLAKGAAQLEQVGTKRIPHMAAPLPQPQPQ